MNIEKLKELIAYNLNVDMDSITMDASFIDDLNADSLDLMELSMAVEDEFDIGELDEDELASIVTVGDLVRVLQSKLD